MKGDVGLARTDLNRVGRSLDPQNDTFGLLPLSIGTFSLTLGEGRNAATWFQEVFLSHPQGQEQFFAALAYLRGDNVELRRRLRRIARMRETNPVPITLLIREGLLGEAAAQLRRTYPSSRSPATAYGYVKVLLGELYLAQGKTDEGVSLLREGVRLTRIAALPIYFLGAESLARAYEKQGNTLAALQVLENASTNRSRVDSLYGDLVVMGCAPFWMHDEMDLARLYRRVGHVKDAQKIEGELRKLLAFADPDFPMLVELKKLQKTDVAAAKHN